MSEFDFHHAYEVCPHCNEEVMLEPELKVQTCPHCGKRIVTCSMCRACDSGWENYCSKCCLEYQARIENEEMEEDKERKLAHQYNQVSCDFFDNVSGYWLVDAWKEGEGDVVVAKIDPATFETIFTIPLAEKDELVREVVKDKLREILKIM